MCSESAESDARMLLNDIRLETAPWPLQLGVGVIDTLPPRPVACWAAFTDGSTQESVYPGRAHDLKSPGVSALASNHSRRRASMHQKRLASHTIPVASSREWGQTDCVPYE